MPAASYEGHGGLEQIAGRTFQQGVGYDQSAFDLYGYDPAMEQRRAAQRRLSDAQGAASQAQAALDQFEAQHRDVLREMEREGITHPDQAPALLNRYGFNDDQMREYKALKDKLAQAQAGAQQAQGTFDEEMAGMGPTKHDVEMERMLAESKGKSFEEAAGPYLDALQKSRGEMEAATGLYGAAARGEGPSAAQSQFQSALDQSNRMAMARAGSMRGGALNQVSAQRDAAMQAGQTEAQAASQSATLRAQEMQAAMAGYAQSAGQLGALDQGTIGLSQQHQGQMQAQQRFYESLWQQGYSQQAAMQQAKQQMDLQNEWQQRSYDINLSNLQRERNNATWQGIMGGIQGGAQAAAQVGGAFMTGGASLGAQAAMGGLQAGMDQIDAHAASDGGMQRPQVRSRF